MPAGAALPPRLQCAMIDDSVKYAMVAVVLLAAVRIATACIDRQVLRDPSSKPRNVAARRLSAPVPEWITATGA